MSQLVSKILLDGKKTIAQGIVYTAMEGTRTKSGVDPVQTLKRALDNVRVARGQEPSRRRRHVPSPGRGQAGSTTLAMRWLVTFARQRREKTMAERLMNEILDASNGLGAAASSRTPTRWPRPTRRSPTTAGNPSPRLSSAEAHLASVRARNHLRRG